MSVNNHIITASIAIRTLLRRQFGIVCSTKDLRQVVLDAEAHEARVTVRDQSYIIDISGWEDLLMNVLPENDTQPSSIDERGGRNRDPKELRDILRRVEGENPTAQLRISRNHVPYLLIRLGDTWFSITYFARSKVYRAFWPFAHDPQHRWNMTTKNEVVEFIRGGYIAARQKREDRLDG